MSSTLTTPAQPQAPAPASHDDFAVASLVLGLCWLSGLGSLLAIIFGHVSRHAARRAGRKPSGMATAGLWLGYAGLALAVLLTAVLIVALSSHPAVQPSGVTPTNVWDACHTASPPPYCG